MQHWTVNSLVPIVTSWMLDSHQGCRLLLIMFITLMDRISKRSQEAEGVPFGDLRITSCCGCFGPFDFIELQSLSRAEVVESNVKQQGSECHFSLVSTTIETAASLLHQYILPYTSSRYITTTKGQFSLDSPPSII